MEEQPQSRWVGKRRMLRACILPGFQLIVGVLLLAAVGAVQADTKIVLRPEMIINETAIGDARKLVDEQAAAGDPAAGTGARPERAFFPGWTAWQYPVHVFIDIGAVYQVTRVFLYNDTGEHTLTLSTGRPFAWKDQQISLGGYREWRGFDVNTPTQYLRITLLQPTSLPEIVVYGERKAQPQTRERGKSAGPSQPSMEKFIGTNAFIDDPLEKLAVPVGFAREYHNWQWDIEAPDHQVRFQPSGAAGGNSWFFDDFYGRLKAMGVTVCPAIQQSSPVYFPGTDLDAKPIAAGADSEAPASYALHASHLFQYAARYGTTRVPDTDLKLGPGQPRKSGLNDLQYIENWNEPDKTWRGRAGRFTPYELAAMSSADYDGDQGRMGKTIGVRQADRRMRLSIGGLAGIGLDYLRAMKVWADWHRNGDFPADVINLHHYSSDGTDDQAFKTTGISPEADHLREKLAEIVAWRNANVPKCEIWLTEFGYDTNPKSPLHAPAIGSYSAEETQANWLIRSYLALAAAGVDRAAMFMFRDVKSDGGGVFETCGMVTEKGQWKPKPSYYYIATLKKRLAGMRYERDIDTGKKDVLAYKFAGQDGSSAYVVWCATSEDRKVANVSIPVSTNQPLGQAGPSAQRTADRRRHIRYEHVTRIDFVNGSVDGKASPASTANGTVTLEAREQPIILLAQPQTTER